MLALGQALLVASFIAALLAAAHDRGMIHAFDTEEQRAHIASYIFWMAFLGLVLVMFSSGA